MNCTRLFFLSWLFVVSPLLLSMNDDKNSTTLKEIIKRYKDRLKQAEDGPLIHKTDLLVVESLDQKTIFDTEKEMIESSLEQEVCLLYNEAQKKENRKENIEKVKKFYEKYESNYYDKHHTSIWSKGLDGFYPIDWALRWNDPDFALFLVKDKKVDVTSRSESGDSKIHYLVRDFGENEFQHEYAEILKLLVEGKADINALNIRQQTPLAEYIHTKRNNKLPLNNELLRSFFSHGARIKPHALTSATEETIKTCNLLFTVIDKEDAFGESDDTTIAMATLLKERFVLAKKSYRESLLIFKLLNKSRPQKIPKPIIQIILTMAAAQEDPFVDIRESITHKMMSEKWVIWDDPSSFGEVLNHRKVNCLMSLLDKIKNTDVLRNNEPLCAMLSLEFWSRSLKACVEDLDSIIEKALIGKEESKKQLEQMFNYFKNFDVDK